jgi:hypothetical protein
MAIVTVKQPQVSEIRSLREAGGTGKKIKVSVWRNTTIFDAGDVARLCAAVSICTQESNYFIQEEPQEYKFVLLNKKQERFFAVSALQNVSLAKVAACPDMTVEWWSSPPGTTGSKVIYASNQLAQSSAAEIVSRELDCSDPKRPLFKLTREEVACVVGTMYYDIISAFDYREIKDWPISSIAKKASPIRELFGRMPQSEKEINPNHPVIASVIDQIEEMLHPHPLQLRFAKKPFSFSVSPEREKLQLLETKLDNRRCRIMTAQRKLVRLMSSKKAFISEPWASEGYDEVLKKIEQSYELLRAAEHEIRLMTEKAFTKRLEIK